MILPVGGSTVIKGTVGEAEYVHNLEIVSQFALALNEVMSN